jgi:hypothetical protein
MSSLVLDLWPVLCRGAVLIGLLLLNFLVIGALMFLAIGALMEDQWLYVPLGSALGGGVAVIAASWRHRKSLPWLWRFVARTRRFRTASGGRFVLRYAPQLRGQVDAPEVLSLAEAALSELEGKFGRLTLFRHDRGRIGPPLFRRRVHVYLFPTIEAIQWVFGQRYGGIALTNLHAIVFPLEGLRLDEWLRHELTHLFADRWNALAPPLFAEGLATWLQGTQQGYSLDGLAVTYLRGTDYPLRPLLDCSFFFRETNHGPWYVLAGSFTGFLTRRFGWDTYKRFYCRLFDGSRFDARFSKQFGLTLEEAEKQWRDELIEKYKAPVVVWR